MSINKHDVAIGNTHQNWGVRFNKNLNVKQRNAFDNKTEANFYFSNTLSDKKIKSRYEFLAQFKPKDFVVGKDEFKKYFGAKFSENFVIFENIEYGNALYVMFKNWRELCQCSRKELWHKYTEGKDFVRIIHQKGWEDKLKELIEKYN